jgi:PIN domain nuclease of toxin-antitoxin system
MNLFILDACALLAVLAMEKGAENIRNLFQKAVDNQAVLMMNKLNFLEVYYKIYKAYGKIEADNLFKTIEQMPITINDKLTNEVFKEAGRLKSKYKLSLADSIAVSESIINKGSLVTADHHEIEPIEKAEKINITWFR